MPYPYLGGTCRVTMVVVDLRWVDLGGSLAGQQVFYQSVPFALAR